MSTTADVFTGLGTERIVYRQIGDKLGILTSPRIQPKCLTSGLVGYNYGLHNRLWASQQAIASGTATYYVRVVPVYSNMTDVDGDPLMGTPTTESSAGTTFSFTPFPDDYPCDGYRVYAGTVSGVHYYQGTLTGRFNNTFVINSTWTYSSTTSVLSAQASGVPHFVSCNEVYQAEGTVDSRVFFGGGKVYKDGIAKVAQASAAPVLTGGTAAESTAATWAAITDGSFRIRLAWRETLDWDSNFNFTGIDFTGDASMADVAATIQTAVRATKVPTLYCGTGYETGITAWNAITAGGFDIYVSGVLKQVTGCDFSGCLANTDVATVIQTRLQALGGTCTAATCTWDSTATRFIIKANEATPTAYHTLSYVYPPTGASTQDVSAPLDGREDSSTAVLDRHGKAASTETVTWSTDHFVITGATAGYQYHLGYLSAATADTGTDISTATYMDCLSTSQMASYLAGATAFRTVYGEGVTWGQWTVGAKFRIEAEGKEYLIEEAYDTNVLYLETTYSGVGLGFYQPYVITPYYDQFYYTQYGNPFKFDDSQVPNVVKLPTADGDRLVAIRRLGRNIALIMRHHIWLISGTDVAAPMLVSNFYGALNNECVVEYGSGLAMFTGKDFVYLSGGSIQSLDTESRTKNIISRLSAYAPEPHGVYLQEDGRDRIIWWMGIDNSHYCNVAVCFYPKEGDFVLYYQKDANCSAVLRDENEKEYLVTGSQYDDAHSVPAFTFLHSSTYKNDGATQDTAKTIQGVIASVGAATETAGYLTCGTFGNTLANLQAVTSGYFKVNIDNADYTVGPIDFSGAADLAACATLIQSAIRTQTGDTETCAYTSGKFVITSSTTTNRSHVDYMTPYAIALGDTDLSSKAYLNGRYGYATKTFAVNYQTLTLYDYASVTPALATVSDGEKGVWVYVCDATYRNGQYALITSNTATTITCTPAFTTAPEAGWYWFIGGIVPSYTKWFNFDSPQHKSKVYSLAITVKPETDTELNNLTVHGMQHLSTTIRTTDTNAIGGTSDTVQTFKIHDREANQHGFKIMRPNSKADLHIEDITVSHSPRI